MPDAIAPIGIDPNQIRMQFANALQADDQSKLPTETFSQVMWQTVLKECLDFEAFAGGGEGLGGGMYSDIVKEGLSSAVAAQLAQQNPLTMAGVEAAPVSPKNHE